ncbi:potassium channel-interacting protein KChIP isoform X2 [Ciona intestinalis]
MTNRYQLYALDYRKAVSLPNSGTSTTDAGNLFNELDEREKAAHLRHGSNESSALLVKGNGDYEKLVSNTLSPARRSVSLQPEGMEVEIWSPPQPPNGKSKIPSSGKLLRGRSDEKKQGFVSISPDPETMSEDMQSVAESKAEGCGKARNAWKQRLVQFLGRISGGVLSYLEGKKEDADGAEIERQTLRYMPESIERLMALTNFDRRELKTLYRNFKNECPNGVVNEETFKSIYCQFFPNGDADMYAHYVFRAFDHSEEGHVNFEEFAIGLSSLLRGSLIDRLHWTFRLYDINHDGYITREEMLSIIKSVYQLLGSHVKPSLSDDNYMEHTDRIFNKLDLNGDGLVTMEEFCETCTKDESIVRSMSIFDHAL